MSISNVVKNYVKEFYTVSYDPKYKQIILGDELESSKNTIIYIGRVGRCKIVLIWGKIEEITGIQYHHKEFQSDLSKLFFEIITNNKSKDFFKLLIDENIPVSLNLNEVIEEFPILID